MILNNMKSSQEIESVGYMNNEKSGQVLELEMEF